MQGLELSPNKKLQSFDDEAKTCLDICQLMKIVVWNLLLMTTPYPSLGVLYFLYYFFASIREGWNSRRGAACFHASTPTFWTTNLECLEWNFSSHSFHLRRGGASVATPRFIHGLSFWPNCRCHQILVELEKLWKNLTRWLHLLRRLSGIQMMAEFGKRSKVTLIQALSFIFRLFSKNLLRYGYKCAAAARYNFQS